jgi:O-antigen/teichoic acid export membrane protein
MTRLLTPADFGLIAMVASCAGIIGVLQDTGLNQAIIQRPKISKAQLSALFWLSVLWTLLLAVVLALCAPGIAWFFKDNRLTSITFASAVGMMLGATQSQHLALMNRELRFRALALIDVLVATASTVAGVTVAWITASYWSLVVSGLVSIMAGTVCVWV